MPISNQHAADVLAADTASTLYVSLHTSSPGAIADISTELSGGGYARQEVSSWTTPSSRSTLSDEVVTFLSLPAATVTHGAVWDAVSGGTMLYYGEWDDPYVVEANGGLTIPVSDIALSLD